MFPNRLPLPRFEHPAEIYEAIIHEHRQSAVRMGEFLMACGWSIGDAAWAAVNWDLRTMAAAIAKERETRSLRLTSFSEAELAEFKAEMERTKKATAQLRPKRTTRIVRTPRINLRPPQKPPDSKP